MKVDRLPKISNNKHVRFPKLPKEDKVKLKLKFVVVSRAMMKNKQDKRTEWKEERKRYFTRGGPFRDFSEWMTFEQSLDGNGGSRAMWLWTEVGRSCEQKNYTLHVEKSLGLKRYIGGGEEMW